MKFNAVALVAAAGAATASPVEPRQQGGGGDGPFGQGRYTTDNTLQAHTIYYPSNAASAGTAKFPVLVWGNGGCGGDGTSNAALLQQVASYGYLAIASGAPRGGQGTNSGMMRASIDWAVSNAGKGTYAAVDATKIMAAGFSCGGVEAMDMAWDSRVKTIGVISSGLLTNYTAASKFDKPILYTLGGSGDVAYANGERDFKALPANTPSWKGNLNVGHGGTLFDANGGKFGKAILNWMEYYFKNSTKGADYIIGTGWRADGWAVETRALNLFKPLA